MANIKRLIGLSDWLTFKLKTMLLDPPEIKLRMRPISGLAPLDSLLPEMKQIRVSKIIIDAVLDAVEEWDLAIEGKPLELTPENKSIYLVPLLGEVIEGTDDLFGMTLLIYGRATENFLKK